MLWNWIECFALLLLVVTSANLENVNNKTDQRTEGALTKSAYNSSCGSYELRSKDDNSLMGTEDCKFPQLFSTKTESCEPFANVSCGNRTEPITPCEYPNSNCTRPKGENTSLCTCDEYSDLNYGMCMMLKDGDHVWPARHWSPFYVQCTSKRTIPTTCEGPSVIYNFFQNECQLVYKVVNEAYSLSLSLDIPESLYHLISYRPTMSIHKTAEAIFTTNVILSPTKYSELLTTFDVSGTVSDIEPTAILSFADSASRSLSYTTPPLSNFQLSPTIISHLDSSFNNMEITSEFYSTSSGIALTNRLESLTHISIAKGNETVVKTHAEVTSTDTITVTNVHNLYNTFGLTQSKSEMQSFEPTSSSFRNLIQTSRSIIDSHSLAPDIQHSTLSTLTESSDTLFSSETAQSFSAPSLTNSSSSSYSEFLVTPTVVSEYSSMIMMPDHSTLRHPTQMSLIPTTSSSMSTISSIMSSSLKSKDKSVSSVDFSMKSHTSQLVPISIAVGSSDIQVPFSTIPSSFVVPSSSFKTTTEFVFSPSVSRSLRAPVKIKSSSFSISTSTLFSSLNGLSIFHTTKPNFKETSTSLHYSSPFSSLSTADQTINGSTVLSPTSLPLPVSKPTSSLFSSHLLPSFSSVLCETSIFSSTSSRLSTFQSKSTSSHISSPYTSLSSVEPSSIASIIQAAVVSISPLPSLTSSSSSSLLYSEQYSSFTSSSIQPSSTFQTLKSSIFKPQMSVNALDSDSNVASSSTSHQSGLSLITGRVSPTESVYESSYLEMSEFSTEDILPSISLSSKLYITMSKQTVDVLSASDTLTTSSSLFMSEPMSKKSADTASISTELPSKLQTEHIITSSVSMPMPIKTSSGLISSTPSSSDGNSASLKPSPTPTDSSGILNPTINFFNKESSEITASVTFSSEIVPSASYIALISSATIHPSSTQTTPTTNKKGATSAAEREKNNMTSLAIGVGVGGGIVLLCLIMLVVIIVLRKRKKRGKRDFFQVRLPPELFMTRSL